MLAIVVWTASLTVVAESTASAHGSAALGVKTEYRKVLLAEFLGPARAVCSQLTPAGVRAYTRGTTNCAHECAAVSRAIGLKLGGGRDSATARREWRGEVAITVAHLTVKLRGRTAIAIDGLRGGPREGLVDVDGHWKFSTAPPPP